MQTCFDFRGSRFVGGLLALVLFGALCAVNASASSLWVFTAPATLGNSQPYQAGIPVNLGNVFTANSSFTAYSLGAYYESDLTGPEEVGLYDSFGTLLASAIIQLTDPVVDGYYMQAIAPVALTAGNQYTVVEFVGNNPWSFGPGTGPVPTSPLITFDYDSYNYTNSLAFTTDRYGSGPAYYGGNVGTPEPGTFGLVAGVLALAGCLRSRKIRVRG